MTQINDNNVQRSFNKATYWSYFHESYSFLFMSVFTVNTFTNIDSNKVYYKASRRANTYEARKD